MNGEFISLVVSVLVIGTAIWVASDADRVMGDMPKEKRKELGWWSPAEWAIGCLLLWILVFPVYLVKRSTYVRVVGQYRATNGNARGA